MPLDRSRSAPARPWRPPPAVRDIAVVGVALTLIAIIGRPLDARLPVQNITLMMALFAAAATTTAAMLAALAARMTDDQRVGWLSIVLGSYGLLAIPTATIGVLDMGPAPAVGAARFLVHTLVVALLLVALIAPGSPSGWRAAGALLGVAVLVGTAGGLGSAFPAAADAVSTSQPLRLGVVLTWMGLGFAIAALAARRQAWAMWRIGLGVAVIGLAHTGRVTVAPSPVADLGLTFSGFRLVGVALVLWGSIRLVRDAVDLLDDARADQEDELRLAEIRLARTIERDHELRSGLAGLAGATNILGSGRPDPDTAVLGTVVASELNRLDDLLRAPVGMRHRARPMSYAVAPVLSGLVALRSSAGMDLHLDVDPGLRALGSSTMLAQVITNVLGNAVRHAPGSPVRISATRADDLVVIRVQDRGPGVARGREQAVLEAGVRDERAGGLGLGLHICQGLLASENGTIAILPMTPDHAGCTVVVRLPAASVSAMPADTAIGVWSNAS